MSTNQPARATDVPRWSSARGAVARLVAYGLPLLLVVAAVADLNLWPATGWRLFSGVRTGTAATWIVEATTSSGDVVRVDPGAGVEARRNWRHQLDASVDDPARQGELCRQWLGDARAVDSDLRSLSIRRAVVEIPRRPAPAPVTWSRVVHTC